MWPGANYHVHFRLIITIFEANFTTFVWQRPVVLCVKITFSVWFLVNELLAGAHLRYKFDPLTWANQLFGSNDRKLVIYLFWSPYVCFAETHVYHLFFISVRSVHFSSFIEFWALVGVILRKLDFALKNMLWFLWKFHIFSFVPIFFRWSAYIWFACKWSEVFTSLHVVIKHSQKKKCLQVSNYWTKIVSENKKQKKTNRANTTKKGHQIFFLSFSANDRRFMPFL